MSFFFSFFKKSLVASRVSAVAVAVAVLWVGLFFFGGVVVLIIYYVMRARVGGCAFCVCGPPFGLFPLLPVFRPSLKVSCSARWQFKCLFRVTCRAGGGWS